MIISCIFLFLTLFVYIVDPELHRPLFGKITIGFVLNNLAAFLCLAVAYLGKRSNSSMLMRGTSGCIVIGYISLYTFTSFMMWINAMAANIFFKFSNMMSGAGAPDNSKNLKRFIPYAIYAQVRNYKKSPCLSLDLSPQGLPLLLCLVVLLVDHVHPCTIIRSTQYIIIV